MSFDWDLVRPYFQVQVVQTASNSPTPIRICAFDLSPSNELNKNLLVNSCGILGL